MHHIEAFIASLEIVAARREDVVPPVYKAVFARYPEMEKLFVLDIDAGARGHMLNEALVMAEGLLNADAIASNFIRAERMNHEGYGIDDAMFKDFFTIMRNVFSNLAAEEWTPEMGAAWDEVITRVAKTV